MITYIEEDYGVIDERPVLAALRLGELVIAMEKGDFADIAATHSHLCGGGYMSGTCPTGVCG